jgi:hypothetical protein
LDQIDKDSQGEVMSALTRPDLDAMAAVLGANEIESDMGSTHRLMHMKPSGEVQPVLSPKEFD